jgi:4,5-dihydroxyphthalate decarboxylase
MSVAALLPVSLACGDYDINRALLDGSVSPRGVTLTALAYGSPERHRLMARYAAFDACEFSLATYIVMHDQGAPLTAVPAFPHRRFRHSYLFVAADSDMREPRQLEGRRIGLRSWETTAGVWMRGILQDEYGVDLRRVEWITSDVEDIDLAPPAGFSIRRVEVDSSLSQLLERGEIDALIYPETPRAATGSNPRVRRLFADPRAEEVAYFRKTRIFPIMHTVVLKSDLSERHPWLAPSLLEALRESKDRAFRRMSDPRSVSLAWLREALEEQADVLGPDPWSYELEANRRAIETLIRYAHEQGMISRPFPASELFAPAALAELPAYVG